MAYEIDFEPVGRRVSCATGTTLLDAAQRGGVLLTAVCGGEGTCGRCLVRVMDGKVSPPTLYEEGELSAAEIGEGWRLACQTEIGGPVRVHVPPESLATAQRTQTEGRDVAVEAAPAVRAVEVQAQAPTQHDLASDAARIRAAVGDPTLTVAHPVMTQMSPALRAWDFHAAVFIRGSEVIGLRPAGTGALGLAVDIGSTKLAAYLVDLVSGHTLGAAGAMNPQIAYGEDVIARINHAITVADGAERLQSVLIEALNGLAVQLCQQTGRNVLDIADSVMVGNTAMHHLFLGLATKQLGMAPYVAAESASVDIAARDLGLAFAPGAYVHLLPNIAGFVGADHVAMLLATGMPERSGVVLGMDIGTNTEVSLVVNGRHLSCSTASGPAFEGAHIRFGMRAAPGAIERINIHEGRVHYQTVGDMPPVGLCGSGILDLMAQMVRTGILQARGVMQAHDLVKGEGAQRELVVVPASQNGGREITFSRADANEIQLAKGAMRAGVNMLLRRGGVTEEDIDEVIIAGAFGAYLDVQSGIDIGMFPRVDRRRFEQVGNAAGAGARMALLSTAERQRARRVAARVEYIELAAESDFTAEFARALLLK